MAFTTITLDGYGTFAACDGISDSAGGTWAELGGGAITYEVTDPLTGSGSIGHEYASKSGFGYFTTSGTPLDFGVGGNEEGQLIYIWIKIASSSAFATLANEGFMFVVGSDTSNYRAYKLCGSDDNNGWNSGWKLFVFDPTIAGSITDVGTYDLTDIAMMGLWMDTIISVRAPTIFIDQIQVINGVRVTGTGTIAELAAYCTNYASRAWGSYQEREEIFYSYGKTIVGDNASATVNTNLTDNGDVVKFGKSEFYNISSVWALTHPSDYNEIALEKHASYDTEYSSSNASLLGTAGAELAITAEAGSTTNMSGGQLKEMLLFTSASADDTEGKVFSSIDASTIANVPVDCSWDACGLLTISSGGGLDGCKIANATGVVGVTTSSPSDAANIFGTTFISAGAGNGLEITGTAANITLTDLTMSGYSTSVDADKAIYVNIASGSMTITVSGGSGITASSIRTAGCTVTVNADVTVTFTGMKDNTEIWVKKTSDNSTIAEIEEATTGSPDNRTFAWAAPATTDVYYVIHHWSGSSPFYLTIRKEGYVVPSTDTSVEINQQINRNAE